MDLKTRNDLLEVLKVNPGVIVIKFGADWCGPCKQIERYVEELMERMDKNRSKSYMVNIDKAFDLYAFLKSKKLVNGIPVILAYYKDNNTYIPDDIVIGADTLAIASFFQRCNSI